MSGDSFVTRKRLYESTTTFYNAFRNWLGKNLSLGSVILHSAGTVIIWHHFPSDSHVFFCVPPHCSVLQVGGHYPRSHISILQVRTVLRSGHSLSSSRICYLMDHAVPEYGDLRRTILLFINGGTNMASSLRLSCLTIEHRSQSGKKYALPKGKSPEAIKDARPMSDLNGYGQVGIRPCSAYVGFGYKDPSLAMV
jgi:hypothetical protein